MKIVKTLFCAKFDADYYAKKKIALLQYFFKYIQNKTDKSKKKKKKDNSGYW